MKKLLFVVCMLAIAARADVELSDVSVFSGYPWKDVIIGYKIAGTVDGSPTFQVKARDNISGRTYSCKTIEGLSYTEGRHIVKWRAQQDQASFKSDDVTFSLKLLEEKIAPEYDFSMLNLTMGGNANWTIAGAEKQSGRISGGQKTWLSTSVVGPATVTFEWKVSSESGYDKLKFYVGNTSQAETSGENNWVQKTFKIGSGAQTLKWEYSKDGSVDRGSDCGWVRNLKVKGEDSTTVYADYEFSNAKVDTTFVDWTDIGNQLFVSYGSVVSDVPCIVYADNAKLVEAKNDGTILWSSSGKGNHLFELSCGELSMNSILVASETLCVGRVVDGNAEIPAGTTRIAGSAFANNSELRRLTIPSTLREVSAGAFVGCSNLERIEVESLEDWLRLKFEDKSSNPLSCGASLYVGDVRVDDLVIPEGVTRIGDYAFYNGSFTSVTIPESVVEVAPTAFSQCKNLTNVVLNGLLAADELVCPRQIGSTEWIDSGSLRNNAHVYRSNVIEQGDQTGIQFLIPEGFKNLSFSWKTDTGYIANALTWYLDGVRQSRIGGWTDWTSVSEILDGKSHTITFTYSANEYVQNYYACYVSVSNAASGVFRSRFGTSPVSSVTIGGRRHYLPDGYFLGCSQLKSVDVKDGLEEIGVDAFRDCKALSVVCIPSSVTNIGFTAFLGCEALTRVETDDLSAWVRTTFANQSSNPLGSGADLYAAGAKVECLTIQDGTVEIRDYAFANCHSITNVVFPASLSKVGKDAFVGCINLDAVAARSLADWVKIQFGNSNANPMCNGACLSVDGSPVTELQLPSGVQEVGDFAFAGGLSLTSAIFPASVTNIGVDAFSGCSSLEDVTFARSELLQTRMSLIFPDSPLRKVSLGTGLTDLPDEFFMGLTSLESVTLPDSTRIIGKKAFSNCKVLPSVQIPAGVEEIGEDSFEKCTMIHRVDVDSIRSWCLIEFKNEKANPLWNGADLYANGECVKRLEVPDGVSSLHRYAFSGCASIDTVVFPKGIMQIGWAAFSGCSAIARIEAESIEDWLKIKFEGKDANPLRNGGELYVGGEKVSKLMIPEGVGEINDYAFRNGRFTDVVIASSVTNLSPFAFCGCDRITNIVVNSAIPDECVVYPQVVGVTQWTQAEERLYGDVVYQSNPINYGESTSIEFLVPEGLTKFSFSVRVAGQRYYDSLIWYCDSIQRASTYYPEDGWQDKNYSVDGAEHLYRFAYEKRWSGSTPPDCGYVSIHPITCSAAWFKDSPIVSAKFGNAVTDIPKSFLANTKTLKSVSLSRNLKHIGADAFLNCDNLQRVDVEDLSAWLAVAFDNKAANPLSAGAGLYLNGEIAEVAKIPDGTTEIGSFAFAGNTSITSIRIPSSVNRIGTDAFAGCSSLVRVDVATLEDWLKIDFANLEANPLCGGATLYVNGAELTDLRVADGIAEIKQFAFAQQEITSINLPGSVTNVSGTAFMGCSNIVSVALTSQVPQVSCEEGSIAGLFPDSYRTVTSVTLAGGLVNIPPSCFAGCESLASIRIPASVSVVGSDAFSGCVSLRRVDVDRLADWAGISFANPAANPFSVGAKLYVNDELVTDLILPEGLVRIGECAFAGDSDMTSVVIPSSVRFIGADAFLSCTNLVQVHAATLEDWLRINFASAGANPLSNGASLYVGEMRVRELVIPATVGRIGDFAFCGGEFDRVNIPENVKEISLTAFTGCTNVADVILKGGYSTTAPRIVDVTGTTSWSCTDETRNGRKVYRSNPVSYATTVIAFKIPQGQRRFDFSWKVDTDSYSALKVSVDGVDLATIQKNTGWADASYAFDGNEHIVQFAYRQGYSRYSGYENCGWVAVEREYEHPLTFTDVFPDASPTAVELGNGFTTIPDDFFRNCVNLESVTIPDSVQYIGLDAFNGCVNLKRVNVGSLDSWLGVTYGNESSDPLSTGAQLYSGETPLSGEVVFDANGGQVGVPSVTRTFGREIGMLPRPTRDGFCWLGWFTERDGGDPVDETSVVVGNMTIYAHWQDKAEISLPEILAPRYFQNSTTICIAGPQGATVHYTMDGNTPTRESPVYAQPFKISGTKTIKAIAVYDDFIESNVTSVKAEKYSPDSLDYQDVYEEWGYRDGQWGYYNNWWNEFRLGYGEYYDDSTGRYISLSTEKTIYVTISEPRMVRFTVELSGSSSSYYGMSPQVNCRLFEDESWSEIASDYKYWYDYDGENSKTFEFKLSAPGRYRFEWGAENFDYGGNRAIVSKPQICTLPYAVDVYYDSDGGTLIAKQTKNNGSAYGELPIPVRDDDEFLGWYDSDGRLVSAESLVQSFNEKVVLTAHWQNVVKTLDPNGQFGLSRIDSGAWTAYSSSAMWTGQSALGSGQVLDVLCYHVEAPAAVKMSLSSILNCEVEVLVGGHVVNVINGAFDVGGTGQREVVVRLIGKGGAPRVQIGRVSAEVLPDQITIALNADGGICDPTTIVRPVGGVYEDLPEPNLRDCEFLGWFDPNGDQISRDTPVSSAVTSLKAHWLAKPAFFAHGDGLSFALNANCKWAAHGRYATCSPLSGSWDDLTVTLLNATITGSGLLVSPVSDYEVGVKVDGTLIDYTTRYTQNGEREYVYVIEGTGQHNLEIVRRYSYSTIDVYPYTWEALGDTIVLSLDPCEGWLCNSNVTLAVDSTYRDIPVPSCDYGVFAGWYYNNDYGESIFVDMDARISVVQTALKAGFKPNERLLDPHGDFTIEYSGDRWSIMDMEVWDDEIRKYKNVKVAYWHSQTYRYDDYSSIPSETIIPLTVTANRSGVLKFDVSCWRNSDMGGNESPIRAYIVGGGMRYKLEDYYEDGYSSTPSSLWNGELYVTAGSQWHVEVIVSGGYYYWGQFSLGFTIGEFKFEPYISSYVVFEAGDCGTFDDGSSRRGIELPGAELWREYAPTVYPSKGWEFVGWDADEYAMARPIVATYRIKEYGVNETLTNCQWSVSDHEFVRGYWASSNKTDIVPHVVITSLPDANQWVETIVSNDCRVSFDWCCSCEGLFKGEPWDYLSFVVDGEEVAFICGETAWTNFEYEVVGRGEHHLRWVYQKDDETDEGDDRGRLANVLIQPCGELSFVGFYGMTGELPPSISVYPDETVVLPAQEGFAFDRHSFIGWSDGSSIYPAGYVYPGDAPIMTLFTLWERNDLAAPIIAVPPEYDEEFAQVTISASNVGAVVYYTTDGSDPSVSDTRVRYAGPFFVTGSATIKAVATCDNYFDSSVAVATTTRSWTTLEECLGADGFVLATGGNANWIGDRNGFVKTAKDGAGWLTATFEGVGIVTWDERRGSLEWQPKSEVFAEDGVHVLRWEGEGIAIRNLVFHPVVWVTFTAEDATEGTAPTPICSAEGFDIELPESGSLRRAKHSFAGWRLGDVVHQPGEKLTMGADDVELVAVWARKELAAPEITAPSEYEDESAEVTILAASADDAIYYTLDGTDPSTSQTRVLYAGPFLVTGSATVKAIAVRDDWFDSPVVSQSVKRLTWTYGEYLNAPMLNFDVGGDADWVRIKGMPDTDGYSLKSGAISADQRSTISTMVEGSGKLTFRCKVSSEYRKKTVYDGLAVYVDAPARTAANRSLWLGGEVSWTNVEIVVDGPGQHVVVWSYEKDEDGDSGDDCAWLDAVSWTPMALIESIADLNSTFGADSEIAKWIVSEDALSEFNKFLLMCGVSSKSQITSAQKNWAYQSFKLSEIMTAPLLFEDEPVLKIDDIELTGGNLSLTISLTAGEEAIQLAKGKLEEKIRVGTALDDITGKPTIVARPAADGASLTFTITPPEGDSGFVKIIVE